MSSTDNKVVDCAVAPKTKSAAIIDDAPAPQQAPGPSYKCAVEFDANGEQRFQGGGTLRANGFTIEVKPSLDASGSFGIGCHASIRSPKDEIIFEGDNNVGGFDIDPVTGKDLNGDGEPDATRQ
jgi:hypothetical protein